MAPNPADCKGRQAERRSEPQTNCSQSEIVSHIFWSIQGAQWTSAVAGIGRSYEQAENQKDENQLTRLYIVALDACDAKGSENGDAKRHHRFIYGSPNIQICDRQCPEPLH